MKDDLIILKEIDDELTGYLKSNQNNALSEYGKYIHHKPTIQSLHGTIGGKNNTFVDSVRTQFTDFDSFYAKWIKGLIDKFEREKKYRNRNYLKISKSDWSSSERIIEMMKNPSLLNYTKLFLERNFYRNLKERTRAKPDDNLWTLWFGYKLTFGISLAPVMRDGEWTNDKSEIRRANYSYWTIGHILETGIIDPENDKLVKFSSKDELLIFMESILKRLSSSQYEKALYDKYITYLRESEVVSKIPFLIPELRYGGLVHKHEHRLDFTVLNSHVMKFTGIEISPASSHVHVAGLKEKQNKVNEELKKKWGKEMSKRNDYFSNFGINTITFTDNDLLDLDNCFKIILGKIEEIPTEIVDLDTQLQRLHNL